MYEEDMKKLHTLSRKIHTQSVIWVIIAVFQIISIVGILVGIYNLTVSIRNMDYSKKILQRPVGIYRSFEPVTGYIVVLLINLFFGAFIGVIGSLYDIFGVRSYVMSNKDAFDRIESAFLMQPRQV